MSTAPRFRRNIRGVAVRSPHASVAEKQAWQDTLDQAIFELRLAAIHRARALAAIQRALSLGATWSDVGGFLRDHQLRIPRPR